MGNEVSDQGGGRRVQFADDDYNDGDDYDRRRPRRSPTMDSYDARARQPGVHPREDTGVSLGQQIKQRAREHEHSPARHPQQPRQRHTQPTSPRHHHPRAESPPRAGYHRTPTPPSRTPTPPFHPSHNAVITKAPSPVRQVSPSRGSPRRQTTPQDYRSPSPTRNRPPTRAVPVELVHGEVDPLYISPTPAFHPSPARQVSPTRGSSRRQITPQEYRSPSPTRNRPPTRAVPVELVHGEVDPLYITPSTRRPVVQPTPYVPSVMESPRHDSPRYRRRTPPMTPIHERSHPNGSMDSEGSRTPTPERMEAEAPPPPPRPQSRWHAVRVAQNQPFALAQVHEPHEQAPEKQEPLHEQTKKRHHLGKPSMSPDLWGEPEDQPQPVPIVEHSEYEPWASQRQHPEDQIQYEQHIHQVHQQARKKPKPSRRGSDGLMVDNRRKFQQQVLSGFYDQRKTQSVHDDDSVLTDRGSVASEGSPRRSRARKPRGGGNALVNPQQADVNAYHLLSHGFAPTHSYFSQNVAVTVIKSPRRQQQHEYDIQKHSDIIE